MTETMTIPSIYRFAEVVASEKRLTTYVRDDAIQEAVISALVVRDRGKSPSYVRATIRNAIIATGLRHRPMTGEVRSNNGHNRPTTTPLTTTNDDGDEAYVLEPSHTPDFLRQPQPLAVRGRGRRAKRRARPRLGGPCGRITQTHRISGQNDKGSGPCASCPFFIGMTF